MLWTVTDVIPNLEHFSNLIQCNNWVQPLFRVLTCEHCVVSEKTSYRIQVTEVNSKTNCAEHGREFVEKRRTAGGGAGQEVEVGFDTFFAISSNISQGIFSFAFYLLKRLLNFQWRRIQEHCYHVRGWNLGQRWNSRLQISFSRWRLLYKLYILNNSIPH